MGLIFEVYLLYEVPDRLGAHAAAEVHAVAVLVAEAVLYLAEKLLVVNDLAGLQRLELLPGATGQLDLVANGTLYVRNGLVGFLVDLLYFFLALVFRDVGVRLGKLVR